MTKTVGPWGGTLSMYAQIRNFVGDAPDGRPAFYAGGMLTAGGPQPGRLWTGPASGWVDVPLGAWISRDAVGRLRPTAPPVKVASGTS